MSEEHKRELKSAYRKGNLILFVGAGISQSLGLPSWDKLIEYMARDLGYDPVVYRTFGDNLILAEYYKIKRQKLGEFRSHFDKEWHPSSVDINNSEIHMLIADMNFKLIYTTNYDNWIEKSFGAKGKKILKIIEIGDFLESSNEVTQIIKLHGDFRSDESLVLGEESYLSRLDFESPLDIKLRADILGKSVLFIGYSLRDINMRYIFHKLSKIWNNLGYEIGKRPKSFIFSTRNNPVEKEVLERKGIYTIESKNQDPSEGLISLLRYLSEDSV